MSKNKNRPRRAAFAIGQSSFEESLGAIAKKDENHYTYIIARFKNLSRVCLVYVCFSPPEFAALIMAVNALMLKKIKLG